MPPGPTPTLSIVIPTKGRRSLRRTLESIRPQLGAGDEVVIVADEAGNVARARRIHRDVSAGDPRFVYAEKPHEEPGTGDAQRNHGMQIASGTHLAFIDDDDVYTAGALAAMRAAACDRPAIFRMEYGKGRAFSKPERRLWQVPELHYGNVSTQMFLVPNEPAGLGTWEPLPESWNPAWGGDFMFIRGCVEKLGAPVWREEIVALVKPHTRRQSAVLYVRGLWHWQVRTRLRKWRGA